MVDEADLEQLRKWHEAMTRDGSVVIRRGPTGVVDHKPTPEQEKRIREQVERDQARRGDRRPQ